MPNAQPLIAIHVHSAFELSRLEASPSGDIHKARITHFRRLTKRAGPKIVPGAIRVRRVKLSVLPDWLKSSVTKLCDKLPPLKQARGSPFANWAAWFIEVGHPKHWKAHGAWPQLFANCKAAQAALQFRQDTTPVDVLPDLVRLISADVFKRYNVTRNVTRDNSPARWGKDTENWKNLLVLVNLARVVHQFAEFHKDTLEASLARVGFYQIYDPVADIESKIEYIFNDADSLPAYPLTTLMSKFRDLTTVIQGKLDGSGTIWLSADPAPGNPFASAYWVASINRLISGLPKPVRFSECRSRIWDLQLDLLLSAEHCSRWVRIGKDFVEALNLEPSGYRHDTNFRDRMVRDVCDRFIRASLALNQASLHRSQISAQFDISNDKVTLRLLLEIAIEVSTLKKCMMLSSDAAWPRSRNTSLCHLVEHVAQGQDSYTRLCRLFTTSARIVTRNRLVPGCFYWGLETVKAAFAYAASEPTGNGAIFRRQLYTFNAGLREAILATEPAEDGANSSQEQVTDNVSLLDAIVSIRHSSGPHVFPGSMESTLVAGSRYDRIPGDDFRLKHFALMLSVDVLLWDPVTATQVLDMAIGITSEKEGGLMACTHKLPIQFSRVMSANQIIREEHLRLQNLSISIPRSRQSAVFDSVADVMLACSENMDLSNCDQGHVLTYIAFHATVEKNPDAACIYGSMLCGIGPRFSDFVRNDHCSMDRSKGMEMFIHAARGGNVCAVPSIFYLISKAALLAHLSRMDVDRGIECLEHLSNLGDALAKLALAELLIGGFQSCQPQWERPPPDRAKARALFEQVEASGDDASRSAHSTACLMLGRIHKDGLGCARNGVLAKRYYRLAIGQSHHGSRPCLAL
jgi:hypothetical protein